MRLIIEEKSFGLVDEGVVKKAAILCEQGEKTLSTIFGRARVEFQESDKTIWIIIIHTNSGYRRRGYATRLLRHLARKRKLIVCGSFLEDGYKYLFPILPRICRQYGSKLDLSCVEASKNDFSYPFAIVT
jgi:GNAT superfamily N-acetyltransferase